MNSDLDKYEEEKEEVMGGDRSVNKNTNDLVHMFPGIDLNSVNQQPNYLQPGNGTSLLDDGLDDRGDDNPFAMASNPIQSSNNNQIPEPSSLIDCFSDPQ
jgi:hypothetical protein